MIKRCDKGSGIIILNFDEYTRACREHLESNMIDENGHIKSYYTKVNKSAIELAKEKLNKLLEEALGNHIIDKDHFNAMNPENKGTAKFYMTFKVQKEHDPGTAPPERPICSGSGTMLENTCKLIEQYIKEAGTLHETYLQDTPTSSDILKKYIRQEI